MRLPFAVKWMQVYGDNNIEAVSKEIKKIPVNLQHHVLIQYSKEGQPRAYITVLKHMIKIRKVPPVLIIRTVAEESDFSNFRIQDLEKIALILYNAYKDKPEYLQLKSMLDNQHSFDKIALKIFLLMLPYVSVSNEAENSKNNENGKKNWVLSKFFIDDYFKIALKIDNLDWFSVYQLFYFIEKGFDISYREIVIDYIDELKQLLWLKNNIIQQLAEYVTANNLSEERTRIVSVFIDKYLLPVLENVDMQELLEIPYLAILVAQLARKSCCSAFQKTIGESVLQQVTNKTRFIENSTTL